MEGSPRIYMRLHSASGHLVLAACDHHLLGVRLEMGELQFLVSKHFYGGDLVSDETFLNMLGQVSSANIVGDHCVDLLLSRNIVSPESVTKVGDVKHVQIYTISMDR
ncbi:MAG: DUF424 domain-containing protein [Thermoplasmatota archaeon]